jgi:hypothetical protein
LVQQLGSIINKHLNKDAYREWPLFRQFRKTDEFKNVYKEIFGEDLVYIETKPKGLEDILSEINQIKKEAKESKENDKKADQSGLT